jgi:hypothetical protein
VTGAPVLFGASTIEAVVLLPAAFTMAWSAPEQEASI